MEKKEEFLEKVYIDPQNYYRWKDSDRLVHRSKAYKKIYLKDRKKYSLEFKEYQVHHKDGNKQNNKIENLMLVTLSEHEKSHGVIRREKLEIIFIKVMAIGFFGIIGVEELSKRLIVNGLGKALMFMGVFLLILALAIWFSREKEGVKYI